MEGAWRIDYFVQILNEEPPARGKLASPSFGDLRRFGQVGQKKPGIDEIGRCTRQRQLRDVVSLESNSSQTGFRCGNEAGGGIDTNGGSGSTNFPHQLGGESRAAAEIKGDVRLWGRMGAEEWSGDRVVRGRHETEPICCRLIDPEPVPIHTPIVADAKRPKAPGGCSYRVGEGGVSQDGTS